MKRILRKILNKIMLFTTSLAREETTAITNGMQFEVVRNSFWHKFNTRSWEPETHVFYRKYTSPLKEVIDIGGWIGPTVLIAYSFNPKKISVVEGDPANYQVLKRNCLKNYLNDKVELNCVCISGTTNDIVNFGYLDEKNEDDTIKAIGGRGTKVQTISIKEFLQTRDLANTSIIKIDIEGGEQYMEEGLNYISMFTGINILLSMHPPFWTDKQKTTDMLLKEFKKFTVYTDKEEKISNEQLKEMMLREESSAGRNKTELFFTLILKTTIL